MTDKLICGPFTNRLTWREIVALYRLAVPVTPERNLPARYSICPTDTVDAIIERGGKRDLVPMRWGLIPSWWKKRARKSRPPSSRVRRRLPTGRCFVMRLGATAV